MSNTRTKLEENNQRFSLGFTSEEIDAVLKKLSGKSSISFSVKEQSLLFGKPRALVEPGYGKGRPPDPEFGKQIDAGMSLLKHKGVNSSGGSAFTPESEKAFEEYLQSIDNKG